MHASMEFPLRRWGWTYACMLLQIKDMRTLVWFLHARFWLPWKRLNVRIHLLVNVNELVSMSVITARVSDELAKQVERIAKIESLDKSTTIKRLLIRAVQAWKKDYALKLYQEGKISIGKAAETAGVSLWELIDITVKRKIPLQISREDLEEDLKAAVAELW